MSRQRDASKIDVAALGVVQDCSLQLAPGSRFYHLDAPEELNLRPDHYLRGEGNNHLRVSRRAGLGHLRLGVGPAMLLAWPKLARIYS